MNALILALLLNYSGSQSSNVKFSIQQGINVQQEVKRLEQALIAEMPFKKQSIVQAFNDPRFKIDLNKRKRKRKAYNALTLEDYLKLPAFSDEGLRLGVQFLKENNATLASVEKAYNVSRFDIAAIIGIETLYGAFTGNYYVFNQYVEEYLLSPPHRKQNVFESIKDLFLLGLNPFTKSSFAGCMGLPQFRVENIKHYGVDGNNDGVINLFNTKDAIFSVANFLSKHGYSKNRDEAIHAYNPSKAYVKAVKILAKRLQEW